MIRRWAEERALRRSSDKTYATKKWNEPTNDIRTK